MFEVLILVAVLQVILLIEIAGEIKGLGRVSVSKEVEDYIKNNTPKEVEYRYNFIGEY